jgi:hypothetical protein
MMDRLHYLRKLCQVKGVKMVVSLYLTYHYHILLFTLLMSWYHAAGNVIDEQDKRSRVNGHFQEKYIKSVTCLEYHAKYIISTYVYLVQN